MMSPSSSEIGPVASYREDPRSFLAEDLRRIVAAGKLGGSPEQKAPKSVFDTQMDALALHARVQFEVRTRRQMALAS